MQSRCAFWERIPSKCPLPRFINAGILKWPGSTRAPWCLRSGWGRHNGCQNGYQRLAGIGRSLKSALRVLVGPAAGSAYRVNGVAGLSKLMLEGLQTGVLLVVAGEWDAKYGIHKGRWSTPSHMKCKWGLGGPYGWPMKSIGQSVLVLGELP